MGNKPSRKEAEKAVKTLIEWAGEDSAREGLIETPRRVIDSYSELFGGYEIDPKKFLKKTFEEVEGYDEMIVLSDINFFSHCEHHLLPITGKVHIGYLPTSRVVGISKLARVVDAYARRMQIQEKMTAQIALTISEVLKPKGVGVVVEATHGCMTMRGIKKTATVMRTSKMLGYFRNDPKTRKEFFNLIGSKT